MKCIECPDYAKCVKESNLTIKRKSCKKAKTEYVMTNADRIRSMSDEELAMLLYQIGYERGWDKPEYALEWLRQPAEVIE